MITTINIIMVMKMIYSHVGAMSKHGHWLDGAYWTGARSCNGWYEDDHDDPNDDEDGEDDKEGDDDDLNNYGSSTNDQRIHIAMVSYHR